MGRGKRRGHGAAGVRVGSESFLHADRFSALADELDELLRDVPGAGVAASVILVAALRQRGYQAELDCGRYWLGKHDPRWRSSSASDRPEFVDHAWVWVDGLIVDPLRQRSFGPDEFGDELPAVVDASSEEAEPYYQDEWAGQRPDLPPLPSHLPSAEQARDWLAAWLDPDREWVTPALVATCSRALQALTGLTLEARDIARVHGLPADVEAGKPRARPSALAAT
jgi:hypothetical protein